MCILCSTPVGDIDTSILLLDISGCQNVKEIPDIFPELLFLCCYNTNVVTLPPSSLKLKGLYCYNTPIKYIPNYPNIRVIDADNTNITRLWDGYHHLEKLCIKHTQVDYVPDTFINLEVFECDFSKVSKLSEKHINMRVLSINNTSIDVIPKTYKSVIEIYADYTNIGDLHPDINKLRHFHCVQTQVQNLPGNCDCHM